MSTIPQISIVIAAYNAERYLAETLDSVLAQTFPDWECIVVDDGSSDGTTVVAGRYAEQDLRIRVISQSNSGPATARNRGFRESNPAAPYIAFMDSDDLWETNALAILKSKLEEDSAAVGAHGLARIIDEGGNSLGDGFTTFGRSRIGFDGRCIVPWDCSRPTTFEVLIVCYTLYPPGVALLHKDILERVGGFDEEFREASGEDWDLFIRLSRNGHLAFYNDVLLLYRRHQSNSTNDAEKHHKSARYVRRKTFFSSENNSIQKETLKGAYRAWQRYKIYEKIALAKENIRARRIRKAAGYCLHVVGHGFCFSRGYPTLKG